MASQVPPTSPNNEPPAPAGNASDLHDNFVSNSGVGDSMKFPGSSSPPTPQKILKSSKSGMIIPVLVAVAIIVVGSTTFFFFRGSFIKSPTTTVSTTIQSSITPINNCGVIAKPGYYFVPSNIKTSIQGGACINVSSSNVNIICNNNHVEGSGPFVIVPPFTMGISIINKTNVSISGCAISNFSYGVYVFSSNNILIKNSNVSVNYVTNVYLNNTYNVTLENNYLSKSSSPEGALFLTNGTYGSNVLNNTIQYNLYSGINVNASNNTFLKNFISSNPFAFSCSVPNGFVISSKASLNTCYNSSGCGFVQCLGINVPTNISRLTLQTSINSCGSIVHSGTYVLQSNLNMQEFVNISNILSLLTPCIRVASDNVHINCNGFGIYNSSVAISASDKQNVTVENCKINNAAVGVLLSNVTSSHISNISMRSETYGIEASGTNLTSFYNISAAEDTYGIFLSSSYSNIFQNLNVTHNVYGLYLKNDSYANTFDKGAVLNSSKIDVYATPDSANASYNLMISVECGYTNAVWATTCKHLIKPSLAYVPINTCTDISTPGNYLLTSGIVNARGACISINSDNVRLNCDNNQISTTSTVIGPGIRVSGATNVTLLGCGLVGFPTSINVTNSNTVRVQRAESQGATFGVVFSKVWNGTVENSTMNGTVNASILLHNTSGSILFNDVASDGQARSVGILLNNSVNNIVKNNTGTRNYIGLELIGKSINNTIMNNTMQLSIGTDFVCMGNSALGDENGGINYGTTKSGCHWLAAITKTNPTITCSVALTPSLFLLTQDYKYAAGSLCFSAFSNSTTLDCNGHTIIATNGGSFAEFKNSEKSVIENCFLKGFSDTITTINSSISILNNTVYETSSKSTAINIAGSPHGVTVQSNNVTTMYRGIYLKNLDSGTMQNNRVYNAATAYYLYNITGLNIKNNTASASTYNGLVANMSVTNIFHYNNFTTSGNGFLCLSSSQGARNNTDSGQNFCSRNSNCLWITSSASECP